MCSGKEAGAIVPGALIVRGDYAKENPQNVAKFLAIYLRAWKWMNANQNEAIAMMQKFYSQGGVNISEASMRKEFSTRSGRSNSNHGPFQGRIPGGHVVYVHGGFYEEHRCGDRCSRREGLHHG